LPNRRLLLLGGLSILSVAAVAQALPASDQPAPSGNTDIAAYIAAYGRILGREAVDPALAAMEAAALADSNRARHQDGATELPLDGEIASVARFYAGQLAEGADFSHVDSGGRGPADRAALLQRRLVGLVGENLFAVSHFERDDPAATAELAVEYLLKSPGHRRNLLDRRWTHAGMGAALGPEGLVLVQMFVERAGLLLEELPPRLIAGAVLPPGAQQGGDSRFDGVALVPLERQPLADDFTHPGNLKAPSRPGIYRLFMARATARTARTAVYDIYPGPLTRVAISGNGS
jgi:uncharacterized protein YkwD